MADGGIHDQLGGGFCRYSVDAEWSIPHFEKMLYDNGPLLALYADLARVTGDARFAGRGARHRRLDDAGDARGRMAPSFRASTPTARARRASSTSGRATRCARCWRPDVYAVAAPHYGLDGAPNFEGHAWNLRVRAPLADVAARLVDPARRRRPRGSPARRPRCSPRARRRVRPGLDDKILTSWNALAIAGLARAARALDEPRWTDLALAATDALRRTAWRDGRLLATRKGERAHLNAYLDDYAFLLCALLELLQARFRAEDYAWARELADVLLDEFEDPEHGGFFFTSHDHERLFHRTKPGHDNATPSGNGVAAGALIVLGHLCGEPRYVEAGERAVRLFAPALAQSPGGYASVLAALAALEEPPTSVLLAGDREVCSAWQRSLERRLRPTVRIFNVAGVALPAELAKGPAPSPGRSRGSAAARSACRAIGDLARLEAEIARLTDAFARAGGSTPRGGRAFKTARVATGTPFRYHSARFPTFPDGVPMKIAAVVLAAGLLATGAVSAQSGEDLLKKSGCTACHANDKKVVGPAYKDVAAKYKGDAGAAAKLAEKVKKGGQGVWGPVPMPPNPAVSDADMKTMVAYILALK